MEAGSIAPALAQALAEHDSPLALRAEVDADFAFIADLYAEVRHEELMPVPWPDQAKRDFLDGQCRLQRDHYAKHYPGADLLIIEHDGKPVGRIYAHATPGEIRLMDIALRRDLRKQGIGTLLVHALQKAAAGRGVQLTLHVEPANPAQHLYQRLGFRLIENRGIYDFLGWSASTSEDADLS